MIESKFKFWSIFAIISCLLLIIALIFAFYKLGVTDLPLYANIFLFVLLAFIITWLFFGELRTKAVKVKIEKETISLKTFIGLGKEKIYDFKEFDGYKISILPSDYQEYEYLYLLIDQKKAIKISQFYHSNYAELKQAISEKTKNSGKLNFNIFSELKEIFIT